MAIVTLKGTVWKIKEDIKDLSKGIVISANINFVANNTNYSTFTLSSNSISGYTTLLYDDFRVWFSEKWLTSSYSPTYDAYSKIQIIDGDGVNNQALITWLTQNATLLYETNTYSHLYYGQNKILVDAAIRDENGKRISTQYALKEELTDISSNVTTNTNDINELRNTVNSLVEPTIDGALSDTSENAVQNKVITTKINEITNEIDELNISVSALNNIGLTVETNTANITTNTADIQTLKDADTETYKLISILQDGKQDNLVSGTNIKTINGESILGEGNIQIEVDTEDLATKTELETVSSNVATNTTNIESNTTAIEALKDSLSELPTGEIDVIVNGTATNTTETFSNIVVGDTTYVLIQHVTAEDYKIGE